MFCKCLWASLKTDDCLCPSQRVCIFINVQSKSNYSPYRCKLKPFALKCYCGLKYFQSLQRLIITLSGSAFGKLSMACWGFINSPARFPCGLFTINCVRTQTAANMAKKINKESGIRHKDMPINQISPEWCHPVPSARPHFPWGMRAHSLSSDQVWKGQRSMDECLLILKNERLITK